MKSGCSGAIKLDRLGLGCQTNKCSNDGTGDLGVPTAHKTLQCLVMPPQFTDLQPKFVQYPNPQRKIYQCSVGGVEIRIFIIRVSCLAQTGFAAYL